MRKPRRQSNSSDDGITRDADQPSIESARQLVRGNMGPIVAACITAAVSLLIYTFNQVKHIDERLDLLEREASALIDREGKVRPSSEALSNSFTLEHLRERVGRLERAID